MIYYKPLPDDKLGTNLTQYARRLNDKSIKKSSKALVVDYLEALNWDCSPKQNYFRKDWKKGYDLKNPEIIDFALSSDYEVFGAQIIFEAYDKKKKLPEEASPRIRTQFDLVDPTYAVVTNGTLWHWYQGDPATPKGHLRKTPFLTIDASNPSWYDYQWLGHIHPLNINEYDGRTLRRETERLHFRNQVMKWFSQNLELPSEELTAHLIRDMHPYMEATDEKIWDLQGVVKRAFLDVLADKYPELSHLRCNVGSIEESLD